MQRCVPVGRRCPSSSSAIIEKNEREKKKKKCSRRFRRSSTVVGNSNDNNDDGRRRNQINLKANERANERRKQAVIELSKREEACKGYCNLFGKTHTLERTREAEEVAKALLEKLRKQKSVSDEDESGQFLVEDVYDQQTGGKMIGVLLCETTTTSSESERKVLKAFSGQWMGEWVVPGWCPPLARLTHDSLEYIEEREKIEKLSEEIKKLEKEASWSSSGSSGTAATAVTELKTKRKNMSRALLERIWDSYSLPSFRKERKMSEGDDDDNSDNSNSSSVRSLSLIHI